MHSFLQYHFRGGTLFLVLFFLSLIQSYAGTTLQRKHQNRPNVIHPPSLNQLIAADNHSLITDVERGQLPRREKAQITKFEKLADGSYLVQQVVQLWFANSWRSHNRYTYIYNANGDITEKTQEFWQSTAWENFGRGTYTFRSPGKIETFLEQHWESSAWVNVQRATYFYNTNLLITSALWERWEHPDWVHDEQDTYTYDESDRMIDYTIQRRVEDAWQNDFRYSYSYENNLLVQILSLTWTNNAWTNSQRQTAIYKNGFKHQVIIETSLWSAWKPVYLHNYSYGTSHLLDEYLVQQWASDHWENGWNESYLYDANNNNIETIQRSWNGTSWININKLLSSFTSNNTETEFIWQQWDIEQSVSGSKAFAESTWVNYQRIENTYSATTSIGDKHHQPMSFRLYENYPNPFNPTTHFEFQIPDFEFVTLKIYDIFGREVNTLVSEVKLPGKYSTSWDATGMGSGVYYYRLTAGNKFTTMKMLLLK